MIKIPRTVKSEEVIAFHSTSLVSMLGGNSCVAPWLTGTEKFSMEKKKKIWKAIDPTAAKRLCIPIAWHNENNWSHSSDHCYIARKYALKYSQ